MIKILNILALQVINFKFEYYTQQTKRTKELYFMTKEITQLWYQICH